MRLRNERGLDAGCPAGHSSKMAPRGPLGPSILLILSMAVAHGRAVESIRRVVLSAHPPSPAGNNAALQAAIAEAEAELSSGTTESVVLELPVGTFPFAVAGGPGILVEDFDPGERRLLIRGAGERATKLVFDSSGALGVTRQACFMIRRSRGVALEQMEITRGQIATTQGTVEFVGPSLIRFRLHEGYPDPRSLLARAGRNERTLISFCPDRPLDPELSPRATKYHVLGIGAMPEDVGLFEATIDRRQRLDRVLVGDWVALKIKAGGDTIFFEDSAHCAVRDVRITRAETRPVAGVGNNHDLTIERVRCLRPEPIGGRGACLSSPGGGIVLQAGGRGRLILRDCTIVGTADDGIAVFSTARAARRDPAAPSIASDITIEGNLVRDNQGRGILVCQSRRGTCRKNTLLRNDGPSILLKNETLGQFAAATETPPSWSVQDWTIEDNVFDGTAGNPMIAFASEVPGSARHRGIRIIRNTFRSAPGLAPVILIADAEDVAIDDNTIESFAAHPIPPALRAYVGSEAIVSCTDAARVSGANNVLGAPTERPATLPPGTVEWRRRRTSDR